MVTRRPGTMPHTAIVLDEHGIADYARDCTCEYGFDHDVQTPPQDEVPC